MVEEALFREVMGHFATGVTIVTARNESGEPVGLTVSALTSVSLDPTLLLVCIHKGASPHDTLIRAETFGVNVLGSQQAHLAMRFATLEAPLRFHGIQTEDGPLGNPLLDGSLAWMECRVREVWHGGDHSVILGEVEACRAGSGEPLLFFRGQLREG